MATIFFLWGGGGGKKGVGGEKRVNLFLDFVGFSD